MSDGGGGGADVSSMTTPSTIVIDDTDGSRLRSGGDDIKTSGPNPSPKRLVEIYCQPFRALEPPIVSTSLCPVLRDALTRLTCPPLAFSTTP